MTHRELKLLLLLVVSSAGGCLLPEVSGLDDIDHMDLGREGLLCVRRGGRGIMRSHHKGQVM